MRNSKLVATKVGIATSMLGIVVALSGITSGFAAGGDAPTEGDSSAGGWRGLNKQKEMIE